MFVWIHTRWWKWPAAAWRSVSAAWEGRGRGSKNGWGARGERRAARRAHSTRSFSPHYADLKYFWGERNGKNKFALFSINLKFFDIAIAGTYLPTYLPISCRYTSFLLMYIKTYYYGQSLCEEVRFRAILLYIHCVYGWKVYRVHSTQNHPPLFGWE